MDGRIGKLNEDGEIIEYPKWCVDGTPLPEKPHMRLALDARHFVILPVTHSYPAALVDELREQLKPKRKPQKDE